MNYMQNARNPKYVQTFETINEDDEPISTMQSPLITQTDRPMQVPGTH